MTCEEVMQAHKPGEQRCYMPTGEHQLRYLLYLPPKFNATAEIRWPVLCFLHGIGESGRDKDGNDQSTEVLLHHGAPPWHCAINSPIVQDFIVVSPQLPTRRPSGQSDFREINQLLMTINGGLYGDPMKNYLTGFSIGAKGIFEFHSLASAEKGGASSVGRSLGCRRPW
jgi:predicted peptidase